MLSIPATTGISRKRLQILAFAAWVIADLAGCGAFNRQIDHFALEYKSKLISSGVAHRRVSSAFPFRTAADLEALTRPRGQLEVRIAELSRHRIDDLALVQEELTFESGVGLEYEVSNRAHAYVYRHGPLGDRAVVLWVPGQSISDGAFFTLEMFFRRVLARDVDLVFYVPPYHLERTPEGFASGDAFLATDFSDHLNVFAQELWDLRALSGWLRAQGVPVLGAVGSSMGGSMLVRQVSFSADYDFVQLMIPVLRWDQILRRPELTSIRVRLTEEVPSEDEVLSAYEALDATGAAPRLDPRRISVFYGRFDQIAPVEPLLEWTQRWSIHRLRGYDLGHALMSMGSSLPRDLAAALDRDLDAYACRLPLRDPQALRASSERWSPAR